MVSLLRPMIGHNLAIQEARIPGSLARRSMRLRCIGAKLAEAAPRWRSRYVEGIVSGRLAVARMSIFAGRSGLAFVLAALCLGGRTAYAQAAPVAYLIPRWPARFSGNINLGPSPDTYRHLSGFCRRGAPGGRL